MGVITSIQRQRRNPKRYNVYIDGEFAFGIHEELIIILKLKAGLEVDDDSIEELVKESNLKDAYEYSLRYLSFRARSENELEKYLEGKGFSPDIILGTLEKLKNYNLINDVDFANSWVDYRVNGKALSRRAIKHELRQKGVDDETIDQAVSSVGYEDEEYAASQIASKIYTRNKDLERKKLTAKMTRALAQRGFDWEMIRRVISECISQDDDY